MEDRAYSLLGLFDINMPLLYGEGTKAFQRLQEEILRQSEDDSLFYHMGDTDDVFAQGPEDFARCVNVVRGTRAYMATPEHALARRISIHRTRVEPGFKVVPPPTVGDERVHLGRPWSRKRRKDRLPPDQARPGASRTYQALLNCGFGGASLILSLIEDSPGMLRRASYTGHSQAVASEEFTRSAVQMHLRLERRGQKV
ncbi:hypothetical protein QBC35DRAFT_189267 [Podospora australis]|uniref:Uncharacterized protein n=1 Tax=Podospora australis TaxID=1536484 RepID=A0AAN6WUR2_9PEZI|nr:hypothetical protein QBC35DRAFT_189267 [Podospora australis]